MKKLLPKNIALSAKVLGTGLLLLILGSSNALFAQDTEAPQVVCQDIAIDLDANGQASIQAADIDGGTTDNSGDFTLSASQTQFDCANLGANTITLTATDAAGNTSSCTAQVTVTTTDLNMLAEEGFELLIKSNVVFENDFENPQHTNFKNCAPDFAQNLVRDLYGDIFDQQWTVETMQINGPEGQYSDPQGVGGDYCLGMLGRIQDDKIAFTFDRKDLDFVNLRMDVSAIDVPRCGGPFGVDVPRFNFKLYDTPSGQWDFNNPGTLLDEDEAEGTEPGATPYTFNWEEIAVDFDASQASNGFVTMVIDQIYQSGYAALDNFIISSSTDTNKFVNQVLVTEGLEAWVRGSFDPGIAKNATISTSLGTATIDNEAGTWYWSYPTTDGPDESQDVSITISNACESQSFDFELIVLNAAPEITGNKSEVSGEPCAFLSNNGTFDDPGADIIALSASIGEVTQFGDSSGYWNWINAGLQEPGTYPVVITATDEDGASSTYTFDWVVEDFTIQPNCTDLTVNLDDNGNASITSEDLWEPSGEENCKISSIALSQQDFTCDDAGSNAVTLTVTDYLGRQTQCSATVTVNSPSLAVSAALSDYNGFEVSCPDANDGHIMIAVEESGCGGLSYAWNTGATSPMISNLSPGTYTLTVSDASGNSIQESYTLAAPTAVEATILGEATVYLGYEPLECTDLSVDINGGTAPYTIDWSTNESTASINVCPKNTTTYSVVVTDANGCMGYADLTVCVVDARVPSNGNGKQKVYVCHNGKKTLTIAEEGAINGHLEHGCRLGRCSDEPCVNPAQASPNGDLITKDFADASVDTEDKDHGSALSTSDVLAEVQAIRVFPNPAGAHLTIQGEGTPAASISLMDASGKQISVNTEAQPNKKTVVVNTQDLAPGVYHLLVSSSQGVYRKQFTKL